MALESWRRQMEAEIAAELAAEAEQFPTLDAWLTALLNGALPKRRVPHEQLTEYLLDSNGRERLREMKRRLRARWPRRCRSCGDEFLATTHHARRCNTCRVIGRKAGA